MDKGFASFAYINVHTDYDYASVVISGKWHSSTIDTLRSNPKIIMGPGRQFTIHGEIHQVGSHFMETALVAQELAGEGYIVKIRNHRTLGPDAWKDVKSAEDVLAEIGQMIRCESESAEALKHIEELADRAKALEDSASCLGALLESVRIHLASINESCEGGDAP